MDGKHIVEWEVHPGRQHPRKRWVACVVAGLAGAIGLIIFQSPILGALGVLLILGSVTEVFFGLRYRLDDEGAGVRCGASLTLVTWDAVKSVVVSEEGVKLSPLEKSSRLNAFRGVFLRFANNRDEVLAMIQERVRDGQRLVEG